MKKNNRTLTDIAYFIQHAAQIREESWTEELHAYSKTIHEAAKEACGELNYEAHELVHILLATAWDDALSWSAKIITIRE